MNTCPLDSSVVLITGGAGILGARMSRALVQNSARVAIVDVDPDKAAVVSAEINDEYGADASIGYGCDITTKAALVDLRDQVLKDLGPVTVLINNAATKSPDFFAPFTEFPEEDWDSVMDVNLKGAMLACQVFGKDMVERGAGSIINTLSIYGVVAPDQGIYEGSMYEGHPINTPAVYSASKAALWGLTRYLATYWGSAGVRVNAITPGGVFSGQNETFVKRYSEHVPLGRMADHDEMSGAVVFLASSASSYVTGHNLVVDGGWTAW